MAVRFTAQTQTYERTVALGTQSDYSVSCWARLQADRNTWQSIWCLANASAGDVFALLQTGSDGTSLVFITSAQYQEIPIVNMTVGTWYWIGVTMSGNTGTAVYRTAATDTFTTVALTAQGPVTHQTWQIGRSIYNGEWWSGDICAVKWWGTALSAAELVNESWTYQPKNPAGLRGWYPLLTPDTADYSGGGMTLSGGSGASTVDGPPISWGARAATLYRTPPAAVPAGFTGWGVPI